MEGFRNLGYAIWLEARYTSSDSYVMVIRETWHIEWKSTLRDMWYDDIRIVGHMPQATMEQSRALQQIWKRSANNKSFGDFVLSAWYDHTMKCVLVPWCNMVLGIEPDGYTHS